MKELKIQARNITTKDGKTFKAFKVIKKDGKLADCKFKKDCKNIPTTSCTIHVKDENISLDSSRIYPVFWIANVEKIEESKYTSVKLEDYFDEVE